MTQIKNKIKAIKCGFEKITTIQSSGVSLVNSMPDELGAKLISDFSVFIFAKYIVCKMA